jgi:hypothetical protein
MQIRSVVPLLSVFILLLHWHPGWAKSTIKNLTSKKGTPKAQRALDQMAPSHGIPGKANEHSIGVGIGQTFLRGGFEENGYDSITVDLYYGYSASHSFDAYTNLHYSTHKYLSQRVALTGLAFGIKAHAYKFDSFSPFLLGGLGFYRPKLTRLIDGTLLETNSKLAFGTNLGAGVELRLNPKAGVGIIAHYHNPFDIRQDNQPEISGSYYKLLITAHYYIK